MEKDTVSFEEIEPPSRGVIEGFPATAAGTKFQNFIQNDAVLTAIKRKVPKRRNVPGFLMNPGTSSFRKKFFEGVTAQEWNSWHWQVRHRITTLGELGRIVDLSAGERKALSQFGASFPLSITPYYASLLDRKRPNDPLRRTVIPVMEERLRGPGEFDDPLGEDATSPVPGLVHRYPDRVLFLVTDFCSTYCRYCTRSRMVGRHLQKNCSEAHWEEAFAYIESNPSVRDVLISGGDPLTLSDEKLERLLSRLRRIEHVEIIRIGTKAPVVLPQRITPALVKMLKRYHPLWMSVHFTHPGELTAEVRQACERLADAGIPLLSQTVLLSGINDNVDTMGRLYHELVKMRVRPYYLFQCDPIVGSSHFRTPVAKGLEIIKGLRGYTSGFSNI